MKTRLTQLVLIATLLYVARSHAQDPHGDAPIDDLDLVRLLNVEVSTATKTAVSVDDAPAVITVVTREDIERWGYQSVAEVLNHVVGFYVIDDHVIPDAGVRGVSGGLGAESGLVKVMIDGRSVTYRTTSGNWLGVELIPLGSIEQIEIIRGPASALYGADAFLGVINIITIPPEELRPLRLRLTGGLAEANPSFRFDGVAGDTIGRFDILLGAAGEEADRSGLSLPPESPSPNLPDDVGDRRVALDLKRQSLVLQGRMGYRTDRGDLVLSAYGSGIKRGGDFAHWAQLTNQGSVEGPGVGTQIGLSQLRVNLDGLLHATPQIDLAVQATHFRGGTLDSDRIDIASDLYYGERNNSYKGVDSLAELRWTPGNRFNAIVGAEALYDHEEIGYTSVNRATGTPAEGEVLSNVEIADLTNVGVFVSSNARLADPWLKLTGGLRYDRHSVYGDQVTGRVGATSRWSEAVIAKLLYGQAFKAPSPYLLYATPLSLGDVIGNSNLAPQRVHTVEYQMSVAASRFLGITSAVSHSWLLDKAEFTRQGINETARNVASQRSLSWETRVDLRHYDDYRTYWSLELVRTRRDLGEGYVADLVGTRGVVYPPWIGRGGVLVGVPSPPSVPLELGAEAILVGPRRAADTSIVENGSDLHFDPYLMLDVSLASRSIYFLPGRESRFALRSRNLLVERGPDPGASGFEYPLRPAEIFLEFEHVY